MNGPRNTPPPEMGNRGYFFSVYPLPDPPGGYAVLPAHTPVPPSIEIPPGTQPITPPWEPIQPPTGGPPPVAGWPSLPNFPSFPPQPPTFPGWPVMPGFPVLTPPGLGPVPGWPALPGNWPSLPGQPQPPTQPPLGTWGPNDPRPSNPLPVYPGGSPTPPWWWDPAWGAGGRPPPAYPSHPIQLPGMPGWGGGVTPPLPPGTVPTAVFPFLVYTMPAPPTEPEPTP